VEQQDKAMKTDSKLHTHIWDTRYNNTYGRMCMKINMNNKYAECLCWCE